MELMFRTMDQVSRDIRMAGVNPEGAKTKDGKIEMPGNVDEAKWNKAKEAAHKSYPDLTEDNDRFWKIVESIYKNEGGKQ